MENDCELGAIHRRAVNGSHARLGAVKEFCLEFAVITGSALGNTKAMTIKINLPSIMSLAIYSDLFLRQIGLWSKF